MDLSAQGAVLLCHCLLPLWAFHTAIPVSTIGLGFPRPCCPMLTVDNFVSLLVSFISHLGACLGAEQWLHCMHCPRPCHYKAQVAGGIALSSSKPPDHPTTHLPTLERCSSLVQMMYKEKLLDQDFLLDNCSVSRAAICFPSATLSPFYLISRCACMPTWNASSIATSIRPPCTLIQKNDI